MNPSGRCFNKNENGKSDKKKIFEIKVSENQTRSRKNSITKYHSKGVFDNFCFNNNLGTRISSYLYVIGYGKDFLGPIFEKKKRFVDFEMRRRIIHVFRERNAKTEIKKIRFPRGVECYLKLEDGRRFTISVNEGKKSEELVLEADSEILYDRWVRVFMEVLKPKVMEERIPGGSIHHEKFEEILRNTKIFHSNEELEGETEDEEFHVRYHDFQPAKPFLKDFILTSPYHSLQYKSIQFEKKHVKTWNCRDVRNFLKFIKVTPEKSFYDCYGKHFKNIDGSMLMILFGGDFESKDDDYNKRRTTILSKISKFKDRLDPFLGEMKKLSKYHYFDIYEYIALSKIQIRLREDDSFNEFFQRKYDPENRNNAYDASIKKIREYYNSKYTSSSIRKKLEDSFSDYFSDQNKKGEIRIPIRINLNHDQDENANNGLVDINRIGQTFRNFIVQTPIINKEDLPFFISHSSILFGPLLLHWGEGGFIIVKKYSEDKAIPRNMFFSGKIGYVPFNDLDDFRRFLGNDLLFGILRWNRDFRYKMARILTQKKEDLIIDNGKKKKGISISGITTLYNDDPEPKYIPLEVRPGKFLANCQQSVEYFITQVFKMGSYKSLFSISEETRVWKDNILKYGGNSMCFDFSKIKNFKEIFDLQNIEGQKIVFKSHSKLDRFFIYLLAKNSSIVILFSGVYQLLKSFDRAFWLNHYRDDKSKKNIPYSGCCPFNLENFSKLASIVKQLSKKKTLRWGKEKRRNLIGIGKSV